MKKIKRFLCVLMAVIMTFSLGAYCVMNGNGNVMAKEVIKTGVCGDAADWSLNLQTGELKISGVGKIWDNPGFSNMGIKKVVIGEGITSIGKDAFVSEKNIMEVSFPKTLKSIGDWAFWGCEALESISLPENLESLGEVAFEKCTFLKNITVAEGNKNFAVKDGVLYSKDLKTLILYPCAMEGENFDIPDGVKNIGKYAFDYNRYLSSITIPDSVRSFGKGIPFTEAKSIKTINVSENNAAFKSMDGNLYSRDGKTLIKYAIGKSNKEFEVPYGVEKIEDRAFKNCESLENITIPDTVISIGNDTFENNIKITAGEGSMAYDYATKKGYDSITTSPKKVTSIEMYRLPVKTVFALGDKQNTVGMVIRLNYEDGTYGLRNSGFTTLGFDSEKPGECEITVVYGEFKTCYKVQIVEKLEYPKITEDIDFNVDIVEEGQIFYMNFVPEKSGKYTFKADTTWGLQGVLYDEDGNKLLEADNLDINGGLSFTYEYKAGKSYIIAISYGEQQIGSFTVDITYNKPEETTEPVTEAPTVEPTTKSTVQVPTTWVFEEKTTKPIVKVPTTGIKKAVKKRKAATVKISLKKIKGIKKYQVQISSSKKFKKVLAKKTVKSVSFTLKSKKIKNKKVLYIRARVIKTVGRKSYSGKWSKPKKVTIKNNN